MSSAHVNLMLMSTTNFVIQTNSVGANQTAPKGAV